MGLSSVFVPPACRPSRSGDTNNPDLSCLRSSPHLLHALHGPSDKIALDDGLTMGVHGLFQKILESPKGRLHKLAEIDSPKAEEDCVARPISDECEVVPHLEQALKRRLLVIGLEDRLQEQVQERLLHLLVRLGMIRSHLVTSESGYAQISPISRLSPLHDPLSHPFFAGQAFIILPVRLRPLPESHLLAASRALPFRLDVVEMSTHLPVMTGHEAVTASSPGLPSREVARAKP